MSAIDAPAVRQALVDIEARLFAPSRVRLIGWLVLAMIGVIVAWALISGQSVVTRAGSPSSADFSFIYASGLMAAAPHPAAIYNYAAFSAAQQALVGAPTGGLPYYHFLYPPSFLLVSYPLASLPFLAAFAMWIGGTFLVYLAAANAILPRAAPLVASAMPLAVIKNAQLGQNGFLTAGLIGLALALSERRPYIAGIFLGLLTYKPQFGVLFPLALLAAGNWRIIASAAATAALIVLVTAFVFGHNVWPAYLASLHEFGARLSPDRRVDFQYQSVFGWLQWQGAAPTLAWGTHLAWAITVAALIGLMWYREAPFALRAAALCTGAAAFTPYVLTYDLPILALAAAFLIRDGLARGFLAGDKLLLGLGFAASLLLTMPVAPLLYALLLALAIRRWLTAHEPAPAAWETR